MRGQFYSTLALVLSLPIFLFTIQYLEYSQRSSFDVAERVISDQLNQLVNSIELDTEKAMEIAGRRALLAVTNFVIDGGSPLTDAVTNISGLMVTGNINRSGNFMMINNTMPNWSYRISNKPVNFYVSLEFGNISVENNDGFSLLIGMDLNLTVSDKLGIARIDKIRDRKFVTISLLGLEDPIFPLSTGGFVRRIIRRASPDHFSMLVVSGSDNTSGECEGAITFNKSLDDTTKILVAEDSTGIVYGNHLGIILEDEENLTGQIGCYLTGNSSAVELVNATIISSGYDTIYIDGESESAFSMPGANNLAERYYYGGNGPDFIQRLEGNYSPSSNGMVTFIYAPELEEQAYSIEDYPRVAYLFFSDQGVCNKVRNMPDWYGINDAYADEFNMTGLVTADPCYTWSPG